MSIGQSGMPSASHNREYIKECYGDAFEYHKRIFDALSEEMDRCVDKEDLFTVVDIGADDAHNLVAMYNYLGGKGRFIAIDKDNEGAAKAVEKYGYLISVVESEDEIPAILDQERIAYLLKDIKKINMPDDLQADFGLSNAVTMYYPPEEFQKSVESTVELMKPKSGLLVHRHSIHMFGSKEPEGYNQYSVEKVVGAFHGAARGEVDVRPHRVVRDPPSKKYPKGRTFNWHDIDFKFETRGL